MAEARPNIKHPKYGRITQGTVFCCATAARYSGCVVWGLTITARCDLAQNKYPILNYLPIVKLGDWFLRDGLDILLEQELADQYGKLRKMLKQANLAPVLTESVSLERIAEVHFPQNAASKHQQKSATDFRVQVQIIREVETLTQNESATFQFEWFQKNRQSKIKEIVKLLSRHAVPGYYLLERMDPDEPDSLGYVCLLREVKFLPKPIAEHIGRGLSYLRYQEEFQAEKLLGLSFEHEDLAMPIAELSSPTIEHVLQMFAFLFTRIGVADPVEVVISDIIDRCINSAEPVEQ